MQVIDLTPDLNQTFTTTLESDRYQISLYVGNNGNVICDMSLNEQSLFTGRRVIANDFIIPFPFLFSGHGNFMLITANDELPNTTAFGTTQTFVYFTIAEMETVLDGTLTA